MKIIARTFVILAMVIIAWWLGQMIASESAEVVVLYTQDKSGEQFSTRLWIVDHEGHAWLRSGSEQSGWYQRLLVLPEIELLRGSDRRSLVSEAEPDYRDTINQLMAKKYGWRDTYVGLLFSRDDAIPVRLVTD
jgi:hypothetical protein